MTAYTSASPVPRHIAIATLLVLGWWCVVFFTPTSVFFRDSAEFILAGFYLDISHPPGYPLYAQLSNLLALIPAGPIAWRIHLFSGLAACGLLFLTGLTTYRLMGVVGEGDKPSALRRTALAISAPLWLLGSPAFLRGALAAEVYVLHGVFLLALLNCFISYRSSTDLRWLIGAAFLGGLSLGNHISGAFSIAPVVLLVLLDIRRTFRAIVPALLIGFLGVSVYSYLPIRSLAAPPLNTGSPQTSERLKAHLTDARDRLLRPPSIRPPGSNIVPESRVQKVIRSVRHDLNTLVGEVSPVLVVGALVGLIILIVQRTLVGLATLAAIGGNLTFFTGWDPDPWVVSLALVATLSSIALLVLASTIRNSRLRSGVIALGVGGALATTPQLGAPLRVDSITDFSAARFAARAIADRLPSGAPFLTEASWFIAQYLRTIEGYRDDLLPIYQPSLLFPQLFTPLDITLGGERLFAAPEMGVSLSTAHTGNLDRYIDLVRKRGAVFFEPTIELNARLRTVARLDADGSSVLVRGEPQALDPGYMPTVRHYLRTLRESALSDPLFFGSATEQYLETLLTSHADLLRVTGHPDVSLALIDGVCPPSLGPCSTTVDLNRALYLTDLERLREAAEVILAAALREPTARQQVIPNLQMALSRLAPEEIEELGRNPLHRTVIREAGY